MACQDGATVGQSAHVVNRGQSDRRTKRKFSQGAGSPAKPRVFLGWRRFRRSLPGAAAIIKPDIPGEGDGVLHKPDTNLRRGRPAAEKKSVTSINIRRIVVFLLLSCTTVPAWSAGEDAEPTPEYLDATFSADDAARVAAGFSAAIVAVPTGDQLGSMTAAADLVFRGTVVAQAYQYDADDIPSTLTTIAVTQRLKGEYASDELTLVQPGGPSRLDGDKLMVTSTAQYFNVGEEEILFMGLDPENPVQALQATVLNRFRIYEDHIFNEDGNGVTVVPPRTPPRP